MCAEEVRLNRRLAPDVYLGVRGVAPGPAGFALTDDADPAAVEFVVEMRRFDEAKTLAARLDQGAVSPRMIEQLGYRLAEFHRRSTVAVEATPVLRAERRFEGNLHELFQRLERPSVLDRVLWLERFAHAFIAAHAPLLRARAGAGLVREGHGDLRAEHVLIEAAIEVVDCVQFDPALRELDVADDLAFLVSDLVARGADDHAQALVRAYRKAGGDPGDDALVAFYACYRALVRAKVELLRASQLESAAARQQGLQQGWLLIEVAERFAWRARLPRVIVVCGVPASGKSALAEALARASGLPYISSDLTRKQLAGFAGTQRAGAEAYGPRWNARTYQELGRRAAAAVGQQRGAVVDATFRHRADRETFADAFAQAAALVFVECRAPRSVLLSRARVRAGDRYRVSDADSTVVLRDLSAGCAGQVIADRDVLPFGMDAVGARSCAVV